MDVKVVTDTEDFYKLQPDWERLEKQDPDVVCYGTFQFVKAWWDSFCSKQGLMLHIVCVYQSNKLVGIAPLALITEEKKNKRKRVLQFAGRGDYLTFLVDRTESTETVLKYIFKYLSNNPTWDKIRLSYIPGNSLLAIYLLKTANNEYLKYNVENPYIDLKQYENFADFKEKSLPSTVTNFRNKLQKEVGFDFKVVRNNETNIFEHISNLHQLEKQYLVKEMGRSERRSLYEDPYISGFIRNLYENAGKPVTFYYQDKSGKLLGYRTCYLYERVLFSWNSAYHPQYAKYRIGKILQYDILEFVFKSDMADIFDLGAGRYPWKFEWTNLYNITYTFKKNIKQNNNLTAAKVEKTKKSDLKWLPRKIKKILVKLKKKLVKIKKRFKLKKIRRKCTNITGKLVLSSLFGKKQLEKNLAFKLPDKLALSHGGKALIIAPHPDDEVFGCGLLLEELKKKKWDTNLFFITQGDAYSTKDGQQGKRKEEGELSAKRYSASALWMGYGDRTLENNADKISEDLTSLFKKHDPNLLVIPYFADYHSDHRGAANAVFRALLNAGLSRSVKVAMYSTFSPLIPLNNMAFKYLSGEKRILLSHLKHYQYSAAPIIIKSWVLLRTLTAKRYLKNTAFWEPYIVFQVNDLDQFMELSANWPEVYPKLVQPRFWKEFLSDLRKICTIIYG